MDNMGNMGGFGGRDMGGRMSGKIRDMYRSGMSGMDRDFSHNDMPMNRGFGDSFGMGESVSEISQHSVTACLTRFLSLCSGGNFGGGMGSGMGHMGSALGGGMGNMSMDRMGSSFDRMGMSGMDMNRSFGGYGHMGGNMLDRSSGSKAGCQIFVRNLSYDLTWQKLKEKFSHCGQVMFAEIKMENGKSKGCGTVRFDSPESAEKACRLMNGSKINGREVDVRIDRNA
ncbi:unnamed protein product, partial [Tetraodon nigroviridis]